MPTISDLAEGDMIPGDIERQFPCSATAVQELLDADFISNLEAPMAKDQYAFPVADAETRNLGMSLRQYLTGQALIGLTANPEAWLMSYKDLTQAAVMIADATLEALQ